MGLCTKQPVTPTQQSSLSRSSWKRSVTMVPRDQVPNLYKQGASPVVYLQQQSNMTNNASSLLQRRSKRMHKSLRYLGIHFNMYKMRVKSTKLRCNTVHSDTERHGCKRNCMLSVCAVSVMLSITDYGLVLTTLFSQSNFLKVNRVQNEVIIMASFWKQQKIHLLRTCVTCWTCHQLKQDIRYLLNLPSTETRHKAGKVKAYLNAIQNPKTALHNVVKVKTLGRLARGKSW